MAKPLAPVSVGCGPCQDDKDVRQHSMVRWHERLAHVWCCHLCPRGKTVRSLVYEFGCQRTVVLNGTFLGGLGLLLVLAVLGKQVCNAGGLQTHAVRALQNLVTILDFVE